MQRLRLRMVHSHPFVGICLSDQHESRAVEKPHNEAVGSLFCAVRCLLSLQDSEDITPLKKIGGLIMATQTLDAKRSLSAAIIAQEQNVGDTDFHQASAVMSATTTPPARRGEARIEYRSMCTYEVLETNNDQSVVIEQGEAFALNRSTEGILLLMGKAPQGKQSIEVHTSRFGWGKTVNVFEVCWTKPVPVESLGHLYLVGCRRTVGPCHYLSF